MAELAGRANIWLAVTIGCIVGVVIGLVTEYYTAGKPVRDIAKASETGAATVIIQGLAVGMESVVAPVIFICVGIFFANHYAGLYGIGIAAVGHAGHGGDHDERGLLRADRGQRGRHFRDGRAWA